MPQPSVGIAAAQNGETAPMFLQKITRIIQQEDIGRGDGGGNLRLSIFLLGSLWGTRAIEMGCRTVWRRLRATACQELQRPAQPVLMPRVPIGTASATELIRRRCAWGWPNRLSAPAAALASLDGKLVADVSPCLPLCASPCLLRPTRCAASSARLGAQVLSIAPLLGRHDRAPLRLRDSRS